MKCITGEPLTRLDSGRLRKAQATHSQITDHQSWNATSECFYSLIETIKTKTELKNKSKIVSI